MNSSLYRNFAFMLLAASATLVSAQTKISPMESSSSAATLVSMEGIEGGGAGYHRTEAAGVKDYTASHLAFEIGGGANAPTPDSSSEITWGGNVNVGAGLHLGHGISLLAEYQFVGDKLPGKLIAETGANGGHAHIWGLTLNPVIDLFPKKTNSLYLTGGGGFYRKVTSFTDPVEALYCNYYYCEYGVDNQVVGHFSSNQGGWNAGAGYSRRIGGNSFHQGRAKLFAEARYLYVDTPAVTTQPNGLGTVTVGKGTEVIPVTFGVRW